jgi:hypothetical protein
LLTIDTYFGIDVELRGSRLGMDASHGADVHAGSIVGAQTGDDVRHYYSSYVRFKMFKSFKQFKTSATT